MDSVSPQAQSDTRASSQSRGRSSTQPAGFVQRRGEYQQQSCRMCAACGTRPRDCPLARPAWRRTQSHLLPPVPKGPPRPAGRPSGLGGTTPRRQQPRVVQARPALKGLPPAQSSNPSTSTADRRPWSPGCRLVARGRLHQQQCDWALLCAPLARERSARAAIQGTARLQPLPRAQLSRSAGPASSGLAARGHSSRRRRVHLSYPMGLAALGRAHPSRRCRRPPTEVGV